MKTTPFDSLAVWCLTDSARPQLVGEVRLVAQGRSLAFAYAPSWLANGFALSGDMPLQAGVIVPRERELGFGAISDAMPDRWGEKAIRFLERPKRALPLDFLYFAGDRRFGALGFSIDSDSYQPHDNGPLPQLASIDALFDLIFRIEHNDALSGPEKLLVGSSKTMGGAHPKALVQQNGQECIVKFPRGGNVDGGLIEHATLRLAAGAGIRCAASSAVPTLAGHVVLIERFDRAANQRLHCLSARSVLLCGADPHFPPLGELSYPAMADFIRQFSSPETQSEDRKELFRRMVFNILIENTDDHEKNHAFIADGGYWRLSPAYDILPLMANAGQHEMGIGRDGAQGTLENALSQCQRFDLEPDAARQEWRRVAHCVAQWKSFFAGLGVAGSDIDYLADFIDSEERLQMRGQ